MTTQTPRADHRGEARPRGDRPPVPEWPGLLNMPDGRPIRCAGGNVARTDGIWIWWRCHRGKCVAQTKDVNGEKITSVFHAYHIVTGESVTELVPYQDPSVLLGQRR